MSWTSHRSGLLAAASIISLGFTATSAAAEDGGGVVLDTASPVIGIDFATVEALDTISSHRGFVPGADFETPEIVIRNGFNPNAVAPNGAIDNVNITGVGQMVANYSATPGASLGTCSGSLINPRTVIFAAHCVNTQSASAFGANTGGIPISFGFQRDNIPGLFDWLGFNDPTKLWQTNTSTAIYNVENVWYDPRSLDGTFVQADVAIATLDTPAFGIPTWAMLFTPLDGQEHVTVTGYGSFGNGTTGSSNQGNWYRRIAENYVSFLGSLADRNAWLFGSLNGAKPQNLYMVSMSDPNRNGTYNPAAGQNDFNIFGTDDVALAREGTTGPGDSGGPLILDQKYDIPLIIGVLSGGSWFGNAPSGGYGSHNFYQPLHAYWDVIVANNPYVYATNKAGNGDWTDAGHWVQAMDPSYKIALDGELITGLPSVPGEGISGAGAKFGDICFLTECFDFTDPGASMVEGEAYFVPGGPGSENFVPNNITANPGAGIKPRYYDVTLAADGTTTLRGANVTVDRLTLDGPTKLDVASNASLRSLGEFKQFNGWTNVDGLLRASDAFLMTGYLTGTGTLQAPWVTTAAAIIAPGGPDRFGKLTIDGNLVMASGSSLFIDAGRNGADQLAVTGLLSLSDPADAASSGPSLVFSKSGAAPRHGQSFVIAKAGSIEGTFGTTYSFQGVLRPELTYGATDITATLRAGALVEIIGQKNATARAFAGALDQLRSGSYNALYNLYGMVDLMDGASLTAMFDSMAPRMGTTTHSLQQRQSRMLTNGVADRLSLMAGAQDGALSMVGAPETLRMGLTALTGQRDVRMGLADLAPAGGTAMKLPEGFSGFVSGGVFGGRDGSSANVTDGGHTGSYFGMGVERQADVKTSFGFAVGYADGREMGQDGLTSAKTTQVAAYGAHRLGGKAYVGGLASMESVDLDTQRNGFDGLVDQRLHGASAMTRYAANAEIGVNLGIGKGMTLTPRAQLGYDRTSLAGYTEQGSQVALRIDGLSQESVTARTGFKLAGSHTTFGSGWTFTPQLKADYVRRIGGSDGGMTVRFAAADGVAIALPLDQGDTSWAELRGGATLSRGNLSFGAGFESAIERQGLEDNRAMVEFGLRF